MRDFVQLAGDIDARIEKAVALYGKGRVLSGEMRLTLWNIVADEAIFLLSRR